MENLFDYAFNQRAALTALMVGFLNGYLGGYVVLRKASLFAGAISHTLFPGIALGAVVAGLNPLSALAGALVVSLIAVLGADGIQRTSRTDQNAVMAIVFTGAFGASLLVMDALGLHLRIGEYLFGNILGVSDFDLWFTFGVGGVSIVLLVLWQRPLLMLTFSRDTAEAHGLAVRRLEGMMAVLLVASMVASMQTAGAALALGLLVAPASILQLYSDSPPVIFWGGGVLGAGISLTALVLSNVLGVQTGPAIVVLLGLLYFLAYLGSPRYGFLARVINRRAVHHHEVGPLS